MAQDIVYIFVVIRSWQAFFCQQLQSQSLTMYRERFWVFGRNPVGDQLKKIFCLPSFPIILADSLKRSPV